MGHENILKAVALAFVVIYMFSLRESTILAAAWGAFQFKDKRLFWRKFVGCSIPILVILPWVTYILFSKVVAWLTTNSSAGSWGLLGHLSKATAAIVLFGLFPKAAKHGWSLIARWVTNQRKEESTDWLNVNKVLEKDLPHPWYSWQVIVVLGVLPFGILLYIGFRHGFRFLVPTITDIKDLSVYALVSQYIVFHKLSQLRNFFYKDSRPRYLVSKRMWLSIPVTVLAPLLFGLLWYLWMLVALAGEPNRCWLALVFFLVLALPFPFYCEQITLWGAQCLGWTPDLSDESTWLYKVFFVLAVICAIGMAYLSIRYRTELFRG